ncbi:T9SS type A sorting domain-containing protein [Flavobacterium sp.]|uniref:T9SS type A sorting domain-containing protein n=1 Tax=Flavobacterium sp. TaxID=239 RepID=UPI00286A23B0|nr:T9SS type A sorting domain-containing protein [Flavobacterium sp.]
MNKSLLLIAITLLYCNTSSAQWTKINAIPTQSIVALMVNNNTIYAASGSNIIYKSNDGGTSWIPITVSNNPIEITAFIFFNNKLYVGTYNHGVFYSDDNGVSWQNSGVHPLWISEFAIHNSGLLVSTLGNGVALKNPDSDNWTYLNASLPDYSMNVHSIISSPNYMLIAAGANGTNYRYDFNNSIWNEEYYTGTLQPGLQINKLINNSDTFFAVNGNRIIKTKDAGVTWTEDNVGSHNGPYRTIYEGSAKHYTITNMFPEGTWIQERDKLASIGSSWEENEELLTTGFSYALLEFQDKLFLAKADGLYTKSTLLGVHQPIGAVNLQVFPNPSNGETINISSDHQVDKIAICNAVGQIVFSEKVGQSEFVITPNLSKGIYFVQITTDAASYSQKLIVE